MANELSFIHAADLHLGRPFRSRDEQTAQACVEALLRAFDNLISAAIEQRVAFLILAGDVFDLPDPAGISPRVRLRFRHGLGQLVRERIPVFIAPGNHDPCTAASIWRAGVLPDRPGVHLFDSMKPATVELNPPSVPFPVTVHGAGHTQNVVGANLAARIRAAADGRFHVAAVHAFVQTSGPVAESDIPEEGRYAPCAVADFRGRGIHYWALGHIHQAQDFVDEPDTPLYAGYCGCLQGLDPTETGPKGAVQARVTREHGGFRIQRTILTLNEIEWIQRSVDVSGAAGLEDVAERIRTITETALPARGRAALRIRVHGAVDRPRDFAADDRREAVETELLESLGLAWLEIQWDLTSRLDPAEPESRDNVLGRLLQALRKLEDPGPESDRALRNVLQIVRHELKAAPPDDVEALEYLRLLFPEVRAEAIALLTGVESGETGE
ncbi:MAG: hypothetical protein GXP31_10730 [Kiritimatiellaeota bacterium]|nr:hypothetical protein [Kiritimatiellota bacterium]